MATKKKIAVNSAKKPQLSSADIEKIQEALKATSVVTGRDVLLFIGPTGTGKSTTISFLRGDPLVENESGQIIATSSSNRPVIGTNVFSETALPEVWTSNEFCMCDLPGLFDNRSIVDEIAGNITIFGASYRPKSKVILLFIRYYAYDTKFEDMRKLALLLQELFPNFDDYSGSILTVVTNPFKLSGRKVVKLSVAALVGIYRTAFDQLIAKNDASKENEALARFLAFAIRDEGKYLFPCAPIKKSGSVDNSARNQLIQKIKSLGKIPGKSKLIRLTYSGQAKLALSVQFLKVANRGLSLFKAIAKLTTEIQELKQDVTSLEDTIKKNAEQIHGRKGEKQGVESRRNSVLIRQSGLVGQKQEQETNKKNWESKKQRLEKERAKWIADKDRQVRINQIQVRIDARETQDIYRRRVLGVIVEEKITVIPLPIEEKKNYVCNSEITKVVCDFLPDSGYVNDDDISKDGKQCEITFKSDPGKPVDGTVSFYSVHGLLPNYDSRISSFDSDIKDAESYIKGSESKIKSLSDKISNLEREQQELKVKIQRFANEIKRLEKNNRDCQNQIKELNKTISIKTKLLKQTEYTLRNYEGGKLLVDFIHITSDTYLLSIETIKSFYTAFRAWTKSDKNPSTHLFMPLSGNNLTLSNATINRLNREIRQMKIGLAKFKNNPLVMVVGPSGAGKSSLIRFLMGHRFSENKLGDLEVETIKGPKIGASVVSETYFPELWPCSNIQIVDTPGWHDNRGPGAEIIMNCKIVATAKIAKSVRYIFCMPFPDNDTRLSSLEEWASLFFDAFPDPRSLKDSILTIVSSPFQRGKNQKLKRLDQAGLIAIFQSKIERIKTSKLQNQKSLQLLEFIIRENGKYLQPWYPVNKSKAVSDRLRQSLLQTIDQMSALQIRPRIQPSLSFPAKLVLKNSFNTLISTFDESIPSSDSPDYAEKLAAVHERLKPSEEERKKMKEFLDSEDIELDPDMDPTGLRMTALHSKAFHRGYDTTPIDNAHSLRSLLARHEFLMAYLDLAQDPDLLENSVIKAIWLRNKENKVL